MIVGIGMVRDEADIIGYTISHLLSQGVDVCVVADNLSTDATRDVLHSFGDQVQVMLDSEPGYFQSEKMSRLAGEAHLLGAEWVVPFDADELWSGAAGSTIGEALNDCKGDIVCVPFYDHIPQRTDKAAERNPYKRIEWRRDFAQRMPKVAFRAAPEVRLHMGNHDVDRGGHRVWEVLEGRHVQYRSLAQMTRKVRQGTRAYEAAGLSDLYGSHWRELGGLDDTGIAAAWTALVDTAGLVCDPAAYTGEL